jgi:hypothetical protein
MTELIQINTNTKSTTYVDTMETKYTSCKYAAYSQNLNLMLQCILLQLQHKIKSLFNLKSISFVHSISYPFVLPENRWAKKKDMIVRSHNNTLSSSSSSPKRFKK